MRILKLQEVTANFNEYTEYANYIGLNSACKMRWTTTGNRKKKKLRINIVSV